MKVDIDVCFRLLSSTLPPSSITTLNFARREGVNINSLEEVVVVNDLSPPLFLFVREAQTAEEVPFAISLTLATFVVL